MKHSMRPAPPGVRRLARPFCPTCNDMVFAPDVSQHVDETRVQHVWSCDSCGFIFETSVQLSRLRLDAQPAAA